MHFPLRGEAIVRTRELRDVVQATLDQVSTRVKADTLFSETSSETKDHWVPPGRRISLGS